MSVPKLRFKEFNGEWEVKKLGQATNINPKSPKLPDSFIYIDLESVKNGCLLFENKIDLKTAPSRAQRLLQKNDILYQTVRPYQRNNLLFNQDGDYVASTGYDQIRCKQNANFLFQLLYSDNFVNDVLLRCTGTSYPAIDSSSLSEIQITIPAIQEQTKIADFLMAVDEKIALLTQKCELLARYKKGVMQQIFSQELRFKDEDGRNFPDWEIIDLADLAFKVNLKNRDLEINTVLTNSATQGIVSQDDYFDKDIANKKNIDGYYIIEIDDFVYNPRISSNAPVGPIKRNKLVKGLMSPLYTVFRFKKGNVIGLTH